MVIILQKTPQAAKHCGVLAHRHTKVL